MMTKNPLRSRINPFSVIAGILFTLAWMFLMTSFASAFGLWSFRFEDKVLMPDDLWKTVALAWVLSTTLGTFLTVLATRTRNVKIAVLNSLTTWAGAFILFGGISQAISDTSLHATMDLYKVGMYGDIGSLFGALVGGVFAVLVERGFASARMPRLRQHEAPLKPKKPSAGFRLNPAEGPAT